MVDQGIYSDAEVSRRNFFNEVFMRDAESMDYIVEKKRDYFIQPDGTSTRPFFITISRPKTARRTKK